jgi:hypothetical protein
MISVPNTAAVSALEKAAARLGSDEGWLGRPSDAWLPQPEAGLLDGGRLPMGWRKLAASTWGAPSALSC